jgi:hypothetical protein
VASFPVKAAILTSASIDCQGSVDPREWCTHLGSFVPRTSYRTLPPGEAADLKVTYDPQAHDGATGEFMRLVYVRSSDPDIPEARLTIRVKVVG